MPPSTGLLELLKKIPFGLLKNNWKNEIKEHVRLYEENPHRIKSLLDPITFWSEKPYDNDPHYENHFTIANYKLGDVWLQFRISHNQEIEGIYAIKKDRGLFFYGMWEIILPYKIMESFEQIGIYLENEGFEKSDRNRTLKLRVQ